jgi:integrase
MTVGTFGDISVIQAACGSCRAEARYRDWDGRVRKVTASGPSKRAAKFALREKLSTRMRVGANGRLTSDSSFGALAELWLEDIALSKELADGTKELYGRELCTLVMPTFEPFALREITVGRVDRFLKLQAGRSYARARHSRVVLNLMFNFALRQEAVVRNPVTGTMRLKRPKTNPKALNLEQIEQIRLAAKVWRTGDSLNGPKPDGQVRDLIEVILGTGARIGEVLAIRKGDINAATMPLRVSIAGTIVVLKAALCTGRIVPRPILSTEPSRYRSSLRP